MEKEKTIFQKIIDREMPATILYEDDDLICIEDKFPVAPVHLLLIAKKSIPSAQEMKEEDFPLLTKIYKRAQKLAIEYGVEDMKIG